MNTYVTTFLAISGKLAAFYIELAAEDKVSGPIRSLPASFSPLDMVSNLTDESFNNIFNAVQAEIPRRSNLHNPQITPTPIAKVIQEIPAGSDQKPRQGKKQIPQGSMIKASKRENCYFCGNPGHFSNVCRKRISDQRNGVVTIAILLTP